MDDKPNIFQRTYKCRYKRKNVLRTTRPTRTRHDSIWIYVDNGIDDPLGETIIDEYGQRWSPVVRDYDKLVVHVLKYTRIISITHHEIREYNLYEQLEKLENNTTLD